MRNPTGTIQTVLIAILVGSAAPALVAHEAPDEHLLIGFYYGHDGTYENPGTDPATLLVDTHPWELLDHYYTLEESPTLGGYFTDIPGFQTLPVQDEEYDGHGFYSWLNPAHGFTEPTLILNLMEITPGLQILLPGTWSDMTFPFNLSAMAGHHVYYYVADTVGANPGDVFIATLYLSDITEQFLDSEPFTLQFRIIPEPASVMLLAGAMGWWSLRRRR